jgi:hypothetical protein
MGCNCNNKTWVIPNPRQVVKGVIGLGKVVIGADRVTDGIVKTRRDICRNCPESTKDERLKNHISKGLTAFSQCKLCTCFIKSKTILTTETCPLGKW